METYGGGREESTGTSINEEDRPVGKTRGDNAGSLSRLQGEKHITGGLTYDLEDGPYNSLSLFSTLKLLCLECSNTPIQY